MKNHKIGVIIFLFFFLFLGQTACLGSKSDPELNMDFSPLESKGNYSSFQNEYFWYYNDKIESVSEDCIPLSMALHFFVEQYDLVYTGKEDYFYVAVFYADDTKQLVSRYTEDPDRWYYLKPYVECYLMMDDTISPSKERLEDIKEKILYALDYYMKGKDFVGELPQS